MNNQKCCEAVLEYLCSELNVEHYKPESHMIQIYVPNDIHDSLAKRYDETLELEERTEEFESVGDDIREFLVANKDQILDRILVLGLPTKQTLIKEIDVGADDMSLGIKIDAVNYDYETGEKTLDTLKDETEEYEQVYVDIYLDDPVNQW